MIKRDSCSKSLWQKTAGNYTPVNKVDRNILYDVIIIGGGITGTVTGLVLQRAGFRCLILEAESLCFGTTGGTTAHINTLLDTSYAEIETKFSKQNAATVAQAAREAILLVHQLIKDYAIDCDFEDAGAWLFSADDKQSKELEDIYRATKDAGITIDYDTQIPIDVHFDKAVIVKGQGKFHPVKYVQGVAKAFEQLGGMIRLRTRVTNVQENNEALVETSRGNYRAKRVIYATHTPMGVNLIHLRCQPFRSYAMAVQLKNNRYPEGLCYDMYDPYHYYRTQVTNGQKYLIVGGYDHKTGKEKNTEKCFEQLTAHVRKNFQVSKTVASWSSQYVEPVDGLPCIGQLPGHSDSMFVAGGFGGNGMTYSHVAALIFKSILMNETSPYVSLFSPNRLKPIAGFKNFIAQNFETVKNLAAKIIRPEKINGLSAIAPGEGRIVEYENEKLGIFKNEEGHITAVNPTCTHLKCTVAWNSAEQSWDCSCHGARYSADGRVLTGPADRALQQVNVGELVNGKTE